MEYYKIKYIKNNIVEKTIVFSGSFKYYNDENLNELYKSDPNNKLFEKLIDKKDKKDSILFVEDLIHLDDNIETIKKKIINMFSLDLDKQLSFDEVYLFSNYIETLYASEVYEHLTQNGKLPLTREKLYSFLLNINNFNIDDIASKDIYNYDDILELNINEKSYELSQSLGQRFILSEKNYHYVVNPFNVFLFDPLLIKNAKDLLSTDNKNCLLHYKFIEDNTIYICLAEDVLSYAINNNLDQDTMINIYYPFLREESVFSLDDLKKNKISLVENTKKTINDKFLKNNNNVNLFYNIFEERTKKIIPLEEGIKQIEFVIYPEYNFNLPLDILFKILQTTEIMPLIKYSPSKKQEKIYRLYCDNVTKSGKKIPLLSKANITKLSKSIGLNKKLGCVVITDENTIIYCDFDSNANIYVKIENRISKQIIEIEKMIQENINEIINKVNIFLMQSGYKLQLFTNLLSTNIDIIDIEYINYITITNNFNIKPIIGCLSSIFNVLEYDLKKGIKMRYKRVDNFNKMESIDAYITDMLNKNTYETNIIKGLMENYQLSESEAQNKVIELLNSLQVIQNLNTNKKLKVKNNPGFLTIIEKDNFTNNILIKVNNINNILYLKTLKIYLMGILQITEKITPIPITQCKIKHIDETLHEEIIADSEKPYPLASHVSIEAEDITFGDDETKENNSEDILDILYGDDDEEDEEDDEEDEDEEDDGFSGGSPKEKDDEEETDRIEKDITGMDITNPNPFFKKLQELDPTLYLTKDQGKYNAYSRSCPWNNRRQPVILTKKEKDEIDKKHPGSYDHFIEYGSNENNKHFYICPRYWDLKRNVSLTEEEVKSGKYGNVIGQKDKYIKEGDNIFEFTDEKDHIDKKTKKYKTHYPGFLGEDKHPDGLCIPCCFTEWNKPTQIKRRNKCLIKNTDDETREDITLLTSEVDEYIKGPDKFPLAINRFGYLPVELEMFINTKNSSCYVSKNNMNLKINIPCILRHGVENNEKQSFIACISDAYSLYSKTSLKSIIQMKEHIIDSITIDKFIQYFNGNLIQLFTKINKSEQNNDNKNNKDNKDLINSSYIQDAFKNFKNFLLDDNIVIDHTYLWDIICDKNENLFKDDINLIIIQDLQNDLTNNIEIICPSNHYSSILFDESKDTLILYKKYDYYEPIFKVEKKKHKQKFIFDTNPFFSLNKSTENIKNLLLFVKKLYNTMCKPLPSIMDLKEFKRNMTANEIKDILEKNNYIIEKQVVNYYLKVIGFIVSNNDDNGYIPSYPSSLNNDIPYEIMDNMEIYENYTKTIDFLNNVKKNTNNKILCKPLYKLIDDELLIGIITETNQFIPLKAPEKNINDDYKEIINKNYFDVDTDIFNSNKVDNERIMYIKKIKLETEFFEIFRSSIRFLLTLYEFKTLRNDIEQIINDKAMIYKIKLEKINELLKKVTANHILFIDYDKKMLNTIVKVSQCYKNDLCSKEINCKQEENVCKLLIPKKNLVNSSNNEIIYYGLLSDQLIRYNRIRQFFFEPKIFLSFSDVPYNLHDNEIILLQSILFQEYFNNLIPMNDSNYVNNHTFDTIEPIETIKYSNDYKFKQKTKKYISKCEIQEKNIFGKNKKIFSDFKEIIFNATNPGCSFDIIITILNDATNKIYTINELKEILITLYQSYFNDYEQNIYKMFYNYGFKKEYKMLNEKKLTLDNFIMNQSYYLTNLDIVLFSTHFQVPIILLSSTLFFENKKSIINAYKKSTTFYIIKCPAFTDNETPKYKLYVYQNKDLKTYIKSLDSTIETLIEETEVADIELLIKQGSVGEKYNERKKLGKFKLKEDN